jgi:hypothetical protein
MGISLRLLPVLVRRIGLDAVRHTSFLGERELVGCLFGISSKSLITPSCSESCGNGIDLVGCLGKVCFDCPY